MNGLPAVLSRPAAVVDPPIAALDPTVTIGRSALDAGIPARMTLAGDLSLLFSVGVGQIKSTIADDPAQVPVALGGGVAEPDPQAFRDSDDVIARVTLVSGSALGDSAPVVAGQPIVLGVGDKATVEMTVSALTITNGSLRSPGQYGSAVTFGWRDLRQAPDRGPVSAAGDPAIPVRAVWQYRPPRWWSLPRLFPRTHFLLASDRGWVS
ncbi:hypothetical protein [Mycobacterium sp.]|uniref:hypothetical protein n=1 Tax=Mycobacterium sp. TaxID=1785 RepID=UPI003D14ADC2